MRDLRRLKDRTGQPPAGVGLGIHFGIFALMLALSLPRLVRSFSPTSDLLDTSWAWMMGYALQHHLQWGEFIVFTYGPLGFLTHPYFYSDHTLWAVAATARLTSWFVLGLGFACILRRLVPDDGPFPRTTLPVAAGWIIGASFLHLSTQSAVVGVLLLVLAIGEEDGTAVTVELALSGALLALGSLIKATGLIVSLFVLLVYPAVWWYAGRRKNALQLSLLPLLSFLVSFCALWLLSAQSLAHLPVFFRTTWEIVSGYTAAMSITGMRLQIVSALAILLLFAGVLMVFHLAGRKARVAQYLLLGGLAFWAWKEGFTLQDPGYVRHPMTFYGIALLIASVGTVLLAKENLRHLRTCVYGAYVIALLSSLLGYPPESLSYAHMPDNYKEYLTLITSRSRRMTEERTQTEAIQREFQLPNEVLNAVGPASVNVKPWALMMAQGSHMNLLASPVIQSYSVYTPYLDQVNARQIWNGGAADKIIYMYAALGHRYPLFEEPATFRAILTCYRTQYPGYPNAVLSRIRCAPPKMLAAEGPEEGTLGKWIKVPQHASYVAIDLHTTTIGKVTNILYKAHPVWILLWMPNRVLAGPYRLIYPVAKDGLFIRHFVDSQSQAALLFSGNASSLPRVAAFLILTNPHTLDYEKHFGVRFFYDKPGNFSK